MDSIETGAAITPRYDPDRLFSPSSGASRERRRRRAPSSGCARMGTWEVTAPLRNPSGRLVWYGDDATWEQFEQVVASLSKSHHIEVVLSADGPDTRRRMLRCSGAQVDVTYEHPWGMKMEALNEAGDWLVRRWSAEAVKLLGE
jgi:hypothetical protein